MQVQQSTKHSLFKPKKETRCKTSSTAQPRRRNRESKGRRIDYIYMSRSVINCPLIAMQIRVGKHANGEWACAVRRGLALDGEIVK